MGPTIRRALSGAHDQAAGDSAQMARQFQRAQVRGHHSRGQTQPHADGVGVDGITADHVEQTDVIRVRRAHATGAHRVGGAEQSGIIRAGGQLPDVVEDVREFEQGMAPSRMS
jgi:hypothetical protein